MNETSAISIPDASAIKVDTSCIDVSEVESQEDKELLLSYGTNILKIVARAALEVGQELVAIQDHFREEKKVGLVKYYASLGLSEQQVSRWTAKFKAFKAYTELFGEIDCDAPKKFNDLADVAASRLMALPSDYREAFFADIAVGNLPTSKTIGDVAQRPEVKLSKAEELLAAAKIRKEKAEEQWEMVKADPDTKWKSPEYNSAASQLAHSSKILAKYEQQLKDLQAQIDEERLAREEETKKVERVKQELDRLKFDDEQTRQERIKHLTNSLTISVPQVMSDLQKFFAEKDQYPEDIRNHLLEQSTYLTNYIADQLDAS